MKSVLVAPLDWGLGHASRCIPIIHALLKKGCDVIIAGNGRSLELLKLEFPHLQFETLPAYDPKYPSRGSMVWKMLCQIPKFWNVIRREHQVIEQLVNKHHVDIVIADNRYGCWSTKALSVFITHQSNILMPKRFGWLSALVRRQNEALIKKFSYCWIPDFPGQHSLAGALADVEEVKRQMPVRHLGTLSRFSRSRPSPKKYDLLCILSGPEPQRSMLEEILIAQLKPLSLVVAVVRGVPSREGKTKIAVEGDVFDMLNTGQLKQLIDHSEIVLARCGFSTVMDLASLRKRAIFIPTPGQTEQEYLAARLHERSIAYRATQKAFDLKTALVEARTFNGFEELPEESTLLDEALMEVLR
ncbi:glycosyltransferase [Pseudochryseolinea flava]|uniref:Glycosyltransferase n=1 Tax=Pseudochryseolinea flava TaxID=2059302 RepID=A0A364Y3W1_9BACT|nr:glycosyltransferase [Pseudochryseolinea flava]RAW01612.1 glycosyltransferase [Pseudochryseolinea flava]